MRTIHPLSLIVLGCAAILGCAKSDTPADTTAATQAAATPPAPAPLQLSDVAGKWNVTAKSATGDTTLIAYVLTATADTSGWTMKFPNMAKPVPVRVLNVSGDSVTVEAGPYASQLRKGVQVWTHSVSRIQDGKLAGTAIAHYSVKTADSVRHVVFEGTRAP
jgi:hypothetical protein